MNKGKLVILFLALLLPVVIFIFLKSFGKNEFAVAPLFQDSVSVVERCTTHSYAAPYHIPDSVASKLLDSQDSVTLVVFDDSLVNNNKMILAQIGRLHTESSLQQLWYVTQASMEDAKVKTLKLDDAERVALKDCIFLLKSRDNAVLLDARRRIIGQYNLLDLDEADRLIMELKIVLKQY